MSQATPSTESRRHPAWFAILPLVALIVLVPWMRLVLQDGNLTRLCRFGSDFGARTVPALQTREHVSLPGSGFDGQFYQQLAMDPLLLREETAAAMDDTRVRGRRCLTPALAWLLGLGDPDLILWSYPLLGLLSWLLLAWICWKILPTNAAGAFAFALIVLGPGVIESASRGLPDLPAFSLACLGLLALPALIAPLVALSALGRETLLLAYLLEPWPAKRINAAWFRWMAKGALVCLPLLAWALLLAWRFPASVRLDGNNLSWPFLGLLQRIQHLALEWNQPLPLSVEGWLTHRGLQSILLVSSYLAQLVFLARYPEHGNRLWRWAAATALFSLFLAWPSWEAFSSITRHLLPIHLCFNVLLCRPEQRNRIGWLILGNAFVLPRVLHWISFPS